MPISEVSKLLQNIQVPQVAQIPTTSFQTSDAIIEQQQTPKETPGAFKTSNDIYAEIQGRNLVPFEKAFYFQNSKQILNDLGVTNISDEDIMSYLEANDLEGLDNVILTGYRSSLIEDNTQKYRDILEDPKMPYMDKVEALRKVKGSEKKITEEVDPNKIAEIRAKLTADLLTKQQNLPGRTQESQKALHDTAYKTILLAQAIQKNAKTREDRNSLLGFGDFVENYVPGSRFAQNALRNEYLTSRGWIRPTNVIDNATKSTLTGSGLSRMAEDIWNLPLDKFTEAINWLASDKPYRNAITTNVNRLAQAEVLGALLGMYGTSLSAGAQNAFDILGAYNTAQKVGILIPEKPPIIPEVFPALTGPTIIDAEYSVVWPEVTGGSVVRTPSTTKTLAAPLKALPAPTPIKGQGFVMLNDSTGFVMTKAPTLGVDIIKVLSNAPGMKLYHGTSTGGFESFDLSRSKYGLFGTGIYATDSLDIAKTYMNKGKGTTPMVYEVKMDIKKPVDMEAPGEVAFAKALFGQDLDDPTNTKLTDREIIDYITEGEGDQYKSIQEIIDKNHWKNEDLFRRFEEEMEMSEVPEYEAGDIVFEALHDAGYDGIKYRGGRKGGQPHNVYIAFDPSQVEILNKEDFSATQPATPAQAATQAFVAGEPIVGEMAIGGREAATEAMKAKVEADIPATPAELMTFAPDVATGTEKTVPGNSKVFKKEPKPVTPLMTLDEIRDSTGNPFLTIEDLDPYAFDKMNAQAKLRTFNSRNAIQNNALDIKTDMTLVEPELGGLKIKEVYGVGSNGNNPLSKTTAKALSSKEEALNGFRTLEDVNGDVWLVRESYIPYTTNIATPIKWDDFSPLNNVQSYVLGVGGVLPEEISGQTFQAVGYQAGLRDTLTSNIQKSFNKLDNQQKALLSSIVQDERVNKLYYTPEELLDITGGDTKVIKALKDLRELSRRNASVLNYLLRQENIQKGNSWIRPNQALVDAGLQDLALELGDGVHTGRIAKTTPDLSKNFVAKIGADGKGVIYKPGSKIPVDETTENVIILDPPVKIKHDIISHIVLPKDSNAVTVASLPNRLLGDDVWAGLNYKDKYFIKAQRKAFDSAGRPDPYVKTVVSASNPNEAKAIIKKLNKIGEVLEALEQEKIGLNQANALIELTALQGKYKLAQQFTSVGGMTEWMDAHKVELKDLLNLYFERHKFTPLSSLQLDEDTSLVSAGNLATRFKRTNDIINPTFDATYPKYANMTDYIANTINLVATRQGIVPTYNTIAQRLMKTATNAGILDPNKAPANPIAFMRDPGLYIKDAVKKEAPEAYQKIKLISDMINQAMDQLNHTPTKYDSFKNGVIDRLVQSTIPGFSTLGDLMVKGKDPISLLHGAMYASFFSLRQAQLFIQTFLTTAYSMSLSPIETTRAAALALPMMHLMNSLRHGQNVQEMAQAMAQWPAIVENLAGMDAQDLLRLAEECRNLGYGQLAFSDIRKNTVPSKLNNFILTPFEYGNMVSRMVGTLVAALRESNETGLAIKDFKNINWTRVAKNSDALSGGSSRANRRAYNKVPILNEAAMFTSFPLNQYEAFYGKKLNLPKSSKLAVFGTTLLLFGASKFFDETTSQKVGMWATDQVKKYLGVDINPNRFAGGLLAWMFSSILGYDVSLGSNAPQEFNIFFFDYLSALMQDKDADMRPPLVSFLSNALSSIGDIYDITTAYSPEEGAKNLTVADKVEYVTKTIMRNISGFSDAEKVWYAYNSNKWIDRQGYDRLSEDAPRIDLTKKALVNFFMGIKPIYETGSMEYSMKQYEADIHANWTKGKQLAIKQGKELRDLLLEQENGETKANPEAIRKAAAMYNVTMMLLTKDMTQDQKDQMEQDVAKGIFSGVDKEQKQIISRLMNPYIKDNAAIQYYNEQRRVNLGGTPREEIEQEQERPLLDSKGRVIIK